MLNEVYLLLHIVNLFKEQNKYCLFDTPENHEPDTPKADLLEVVDPGVGLQLLAARGGVRGDAVALAPTVLVVCSPKK